MQLQDCDGPTPVSGSGSGSGVTPGMEQLASFSDCSCLQFLITCCMQKWKGKAWEIQSHA